MLHEKSVWNTRQLGPGTRGIKWCFQRTSASTTDIHTAMKYPTLAQHGFIENDKLWGNSTEGWLHLFEVFGRAYLSSGWPAHQPWQRPGVSRSSNLRQLPGLLHGTHRLSQAMPRESCWNVDVFNFFKLKLIFNDIQISVLQHLSSVTFSSSISKLWSMPGCVCIGKVALAANTTTTNVVKSGPDQMGLAQQWSVFWPHWHCFWSDAKNSFRQWSGNSETPYMTRRFISELIYFTLFDRLLFVAWLSMGFGISSFQVSKPNQETLAAEISQRWYRHFQWPWN